MKNTCWLMKHSWENLALARTKNATVMVARSLLQLTSMVNYSLSVISHNFPDSDSLCRVNLQVKNQPCCTS